MLNGWLPCEASLAWGSHRSNRFVKTLTGWLEVLFTAHLPKLPPEAIEAQATVLAGWRPQVRPSSHQWIRSDKHSQLSVRNWYDSGHTRKHCSVSIISCRPWAANLIMQPSAAQVTRFVAL
jgi:hypothetical protein